MSANRKATFKVPPTQKLGQDLRRKKALEEQKHRRALKVDASRHLDLFRDLNLRGSDEEDDESKGIETSLKNGLNNLLDSQINEPEDGLKLPEVFGNSHSRKESKRKAKKKRRAKNATEEGSRTGKWANKCMYAELLEMVDDAHFELGDGDLNDGLPADMETGWVAVAPVPVGKRCLAVTHQSSGIMGTAPNTTLHSRALGKSLLSPFPSSLPPLTVLDCILDPHWRENGIIHVLDVVKWKGQDVGDCETPFRFWWRDTRLGELPRYPPIPMSNPDNHDIGSKREMKPQFSHPFYFVPIPYHTDTSFRSLSSQIIPAARFDRPIEIVVPQMQDEQTDMVVDGIMRPQYSTPTKTVTIPSDGMLLYVAQACYEPGSSPLSSWVPIANNEDQPLNLFERLVNRRLALDQMSMQV